MKTPLYVRMSVPLVACILILCNCVASRSEFMPDVWRHFDPSEPRFIEEIDQLRTSFMVRSNRMAAIQFVADRLDEPSLNARTQLRLGMLLALVADVTPPAECQAVKSVVAKGAKHATFYGAALPQPSPEYIDLYFQVLANKADVICYAFNPDGGGLERFVLQTLVLEDLQEATGRQFGRDASKWREWWAAEGIALLYDRDSGSYRSNGGR